MTFVDALAASSMFGGHKVRKLRWRNSHLSVSISPQGDIVIKYMMEGTTRHRMDNNYIMQLLKGDDWETLEECNQRNARREERMRKLRKGVFVSREQCNIRCVITRRQGEIVEIEPAPYEGDPNDERDGCGGGCSQFTGSGSLNLVEHVTG